MKTSDEIKQSVKDKYAEISRSSDQAGCCGPSGCCSTDSNVDYTIFSDDYSKLEGYNPDADLGLGCGLPTEFAKMKPGDTVVDLGSGAGNDAFVARQVVGESGRVIGLDMTEAMIQKSTLNAIKLGFDNVDFVLGDIEEMPLDDSIADVVVSNCVLNLVPDKEKAFAETYRILKNGGHFSISDVVIAGDLPDAIKEDAEMYAGCVAGAIDKDEYLDIVKNTGFENITVQKMKEIQLPDEMLLNYLSEEELKSFKNSDTGIYSITVYAEKSE
ncbi:arsenite methyltransferase [Rhodohalobacter sp.]|uniref:arsenite methyltransferase n=1 Tax=Rhodohalobacter sp. TaxID=1974210 RepID=UPI003A0FECFA